MGVVCDYYSGPTWLDSCDSNQFCPQRLLASRWPDVRMVERGAVVDVVADDFATWLMSV